MIKRLIFDVDGTLICGVNFINSVSETLKKLGVYSEDNVKAFLDGIKTYEQSYDNYNVIDYTIHMGNTINTTFSENFIPTLFSELKTCIPPRNPKLIDTIKRLSQNYEMVLLTNYFAESQLNRLNNMGIGEYFIECYGEHSIKPNREAYLKACGNNRPSECVMIGDDVFLDIRRAKEEGLNTIFVNSRGIDIKSDIGITVSSVEEISENIISELSEKDVFVECYGEDSINPNKEAYIEACGSNRPSECVMIGEDVFIDTRRANPEGLNTIFLNSRSIDIKPDIGIIVDPVKEISGSIISEPYEEDDER